MKKFTDIKIDYKKPVMTQKVFEKETKKEIKPVQNKVSKFFSKLFESREMAHVYHLQVKGDAGSHAKHIALNEYYDGVVGFIDSAIEIYQGQYSIIENYDLIDTSNTKKMTEIDYFQDLADFIKKERKCISSEDTHIHNIIDEIVSLVYKTLYKLKYNK